MSPESDVRQMGTLALFDKLDALSRERALTDFESHVLEKTQNALIYGPRSYGMNKELARRGLLQNRKRRA